MKSYTRTVNVQDHSLLEEKGSICSETSSLSSMSIEDSSPLITESSPLTTERAITLIRQQQRKSDEEHYWNSSKDSSRSTRLSAPADECALLHQQKKEQYWEVPNVQQPPTPAPLVASQDKSFSSHKQEKTDLRLKKELFWEGYNEEPLSLQQHLSQNKRDVRHKRQHEKPYWA